MESPAEQLRQQQQLMTKAAEEAISVADTCITEFSALLARLQTRGRVTAPDGLPSLLRILRREKGILSRFLAEDQETYDEGGCNDDEHGIMECRKILNRCNDAIVMINLAMLKWNILKRCRSLVGVNKAFHCWTQEDRRRIIAERLSINDSKGPTTAPISSETRQTSSHGRSHQKGKGEMRRTLKEQGKVEVDVVDGGAEWIVTRTVNVDCLARELTDAGWGWGDHDEHEDDERVDPEEWNSTQLARQVQRLVAAARRNRHDYHVPRIRVILPNIDLYTAPPDMALFLRQLDGTNLDPGVQVTINDASSDFLRTQPPEDLDTIMDNLDSADEPTGLTDPLNMDHTILIDLISDITHTRLQPRAWHPSPVRAQIGEENSHKDGLMTRLLYPILQGRRLVCTEGAAKKFHEVLLTVGTSAERQRGHLLVPMNPDIQQLAPDEIRARFAALSVHPMPADIQLPIEVVPGRWDAEVAATMVAKGRLPRVAVDVAQNSGLKSYLLSIYLYGWVDNIVTITSNKEVKGQISRCVEAYRHNDDEVGPRIHRIDATRSLLSKSATPPTGWDGGTENMVS